MDTILTEFIARTSAAPGFSRDLLEGHSWDLQEALSAYFEMKGMTQETKNFTMDSNIFKATTTNHVYNNICSSPKTLSPNKPPLRKTDALDIDDTAGKKLTRGISRATDNVNLVSKARNEFAADFHGSGAEYSPCHLVLETPDYTFTIPNLNLQEEDFRLFLQKDLIETSTLVSLEQAGRLNWWAEMGACQRLWPLATTGDGNCLLHAASLGMWGFHDRLLTLRRALHAVLSKSLFTEAFHRRWRWQTALQNKEAGLVYCEEEWLKEWQNLLQMASTEPRTRAPQPRSLDTVQEEEVPSQVYESLEEIHVLALAHVLRRPVIVIADTMLKDVTGEPFAPIPFGGIYLPLECAPAECHRSPLCLTYDAAHFSALVAMETGAEVSSQALAAIPLTDPNHKLLPVQFAVDPGKEVRWGQDENDPRVISKLTLNEKDKLGLLNEYLEITEISTISLTGCCENDVEVAPYRTASAPMVNGYIEDHKRLGSLEFDEGWTEAPNGVVAIHHKSKAAKQLQSVAKQFGSLGRSVSKKIKKNFSSLARRGSSFKGESSGGTKKSTILKSFTSVTPPVCEPAVTRNGDTIVAAILHTEKRHEYQEEMIRNYLSSARARFLKEKTSKGSFGILDSNKVVYSQPWKCVNMGCSLYGTVATNYLCSACFSSQKEQEAEITGKKKLDGVVVTSGKSAFYTESDLKMIASVAQVPLGNKLNSRPDQTLYLAKSVFYHDNGANASCNFNVQDLEKGVCVESKVNESNRPPLVTPFASSTLH